MEQLITWNNHLSENRLRRGPRGDSPPRRRGEATGWNLPRRPMKRGGEARRLAWRPKTGLGWRPKIGGLVSGDRRLAWRLATGEARCRLAWRLATAVGARNSGRTRGEGRVWNWKWRPRSEGRGFCTIGGEATEGEGRRAKAELCTLKRRVRLRPQATEGESGSGDECGTGLLN